MKFDIDVRAFWDENDQCLAPFSTAKPRIPISYWLDDHFLLEEMRLPSTIRYYNDYAYRMQVNRRCNDILEPAIGRRFYNEDELRISPNRFEVLMGARWEFTEGGTPWLMENVESIDDVKKLIDRARDIDMKKAAFPEGWRQEKESYEKRTGKKVRLGGEFSRGPATMATSILGTTNTCFFIMEEPEIMDEFFAVLGDKLVKYNIALMEHTGNDARQGYSIADDNCFLFPPAQYERFCAPVLQKLFSEFAPLPGHKRYQHSDSSMAHLMGILSDLGVNEVNLGPDIDIRDIRRAMPKALIYGQMPPFKLRNGTYEEIVNAVRYDIDSVGQDGGLVECTAGSIAGGTPLENIRLYMWAVQQFGRF